MLNETFILPRQHQNLVNPMAKDEPSENPYAPPLSRAKPPVTEPAERDELQDMLERAFFGATYGTVFLPGVAYLISLYVLMTARKRRTEFSPVHEKLYSTTATICWILLFPMSAMFVAIAWAAICGV